MKKKMVLVIVVFFLGLLVLVSHVIPIRPVVTIINYTNKSLYIYAGESVYNVEPDPEEVEKIVKSKPEVIAPGGKIEFKSSFISLFIKDAAIDISWRIDGQHEYNSTGGGGQNFILTSLEGVCSVVIKIQNGLNNDTLENGSGDLCLKKIKAFKYEY